MNKSQLKLHEEYATTYNLGDMHILLAIGGYTDLRYRHGGANDEQKSLRHHAKPLSTGPVGYGSRKESPKNLMLRIDRHYVNDAATMKAARDYTEADFLAGKPAPENTTVVAVASGKIEQTYSSYVVAARAAEKRAAEQAAALEERTTVTIPKVKAEVKRLGLKEVGYIGSYDTKISLTFAEFLALAARIERDADRYEQTGE